jgi:hypothetical protein
MPDSNEIHLPHASKKEVFWQFERDRRSSERINRSISEVESISYKHFLVTWKKYMAHVKLRRQMRFTKCSICVDKKELIRYSMSSRIKDEAKAELRKHYELVKMERSVYYQKRENAKSEPNKYLSIIVDGSDMANYGLPYFSMNSKASVGYKMRIGLTGVLIHGIGSRVYLHHKHWPNDPNMTIEVLHRSLSSLNSLPPTFYLQVFI